MTGSRKILLVEDNPTDEALILRALERRRSSTETVIARDGAAAMDYLFGTGEHEGRDLSDAPAVVLLDLKLPKVDGLDVLRRLRADARTSMQPVVILTSSAQDEDRIRAYELGANSYVRKPVAFDDFAESIRQLDLYWTVLNEPPPYPK